MKAKDVLNLWGSWDSPDIFNVTIKSKGRNKTIRLTGLELIEGDIGEKELLRFGTYGKQSDGTWKHYVVVSA